MSNFYFLCITQPTNLGDLIINKMLVDELCRYGKVYVDVYHTPNEFKKELVANPAAIDLYDEKKISAKRLDLIRLFRLVKKEEIKYYFSSPGPIEGGNRLYGLILRIIKFVFRLAGAKVYSVGGCASSMISSGKPFHNFDVEHYYMRSNASVDYINSYVKDKASYIPDMAYLLALQQPINEDCLNHNNRKVLVNFREHPDNPELFFNWCKSVIEQFVECGYELELYYQVQGDRKFIHQLYDATKGNSVSLRDEIVWYDNLQFYEGAEVVISNRLHSLLVGAVFGAIPIACVSESKLISKIKDVFTSSFKEQAADIVYPYYSDAQKMIDTAERINKKEIYDKVMESATECRYIISDIVGENEW